MLILGLSNMRDASAALLKDGRIIAAAEEERFVRIKHVTALPIQAIRYCLQEAGIEPDAIDGIAVPWKYWVLGRRSVLALGAMLRSPQLLRVKGKRSIERMRQEWTELASLSTKLTRALGPFRVKPTYLEHHLCHAASSFLLSPFERAAILVIDGASESHTALFALGEGTHIKPLKRIPLPHSLGQFYAAMTAFLGFRPDYDEYIVMGLAAYGRPVYARQVREHILSLRPEGSFSLNTRILDFHLARVGVFPLVLQRLLGPNRRRDEEITQRHRDIAASAQLILEETVLHMAHYLRSMSDTDNLCLAGGVTYNCVANSRLAQESEFKHIYIQPAAGDAGTALGAALLLSSRSAPHQSREVMRHAYFGPQFSEDHCREALHRAGLKGDMLPDEQLCDRVASELSRGRIVFWFQGRMEWGPRALGHRSLLADPRREDMRELINAKVKLREPFRPFAPAVLQERAADFFDWPHPSPFMLFTVPVLPKAKGLIPAVTHVDGTARIQTVDRESNSKFRMLLEAFDQKTGVPILLNTSFNVNEPIVCTPDEAIRCFLRTEVDWLALGNVLVSRPGQCDRGCKF